MWAATYFLEEASKTLGFLVTEYGFSPPQLEEDKRYRYGADVRFTGKNLAVELLAESRPGEEGVMCYIARVLNGKKTTAFVDKRGARESLDALLVRRGVRERLWRSQAGLEFREQIRVTLEDVARILKTHGQDILADSPTALD